MDEEKAMDYQDFQLRVYDLSMQVVKMTPANMMEIAAERKTVIEGKPSYAALKRASGFVDQVNLGAFLYYDKVTGLSRPGMLEELLDYRKRLDLDRDEALKREQERAKKNSKAG